MTIYCFESAELKNKRKRFYQPPKGIPLVPMPVSSSPRAHQRSGLRRLADALEKISLQPPTAEHHRRPPTVLRLPTAPPVRARSRAYFTGSLRGAGSHPSWRGTSWGMKGWRRVSVGGEWLRGAARHGTAQPLLPAPLLWEKLRGRFNISSRCGR